MLSRAFNNQAVNKRELTAQGLSHPGMESTLELYHSSPISHDFQQLQETDRRKGDGPFDANTLEDPATN